MPTQNAYALRLNQLIDSVVQTDGLSPRVKDVSLRVLSGILSIQQNSPELLLDSSVANGFWTSANKIMARLSEVLDEGSVDLLDWTLDLLDKLITALNDRRRDQEISGFDTRETRAEIDRAVELVQHVSMIKTAERLDRSGRVLDEIEDVADAARTAAGSIGGDNLAHYFGDYATAEKRAADMFRLATILLIAGGAGLSLFLPHVATDDWIALAYRLVFVSAIAGLAAYFGRQASQHRRIANWAKSLHVQVLAFPAFVSPIQDEASKNAIYSAFANRLLGAPPERSLAKGDVDQSAAQLIDLATAFVKKA